MLYKPVKTVAGKNADVMRLISDETGNVREWAEVSWVTASPVGDVQEASYRGDFRGASFAAPQVAALAALLRNAKPSARYYEVANRIVWTRRQDIEQTMESTYGIPLAGLVDFNAALTGW